MFGLHYITPPDWAPRVMEQEGDLLLDHYFAELSAAAMARRTYKVYGKRYPALKELMEDLAKEEYEHADVVQNLLNKSYPPKNFSKGGSIYAQGLRKFADGKGCGQFLDLLMLCAMVEGRSAERFKLLADYTKGTPFGSFYEDFYASEAGHYALFVKLGYELVGPEKTMKRLNEFRAKEAILIQALPQGPRIH